jgi:hypothetical protein
LQDDLARLRVNPITEQADADGRWCLAGALSATGTDIGRYVHALMNAAHHRPHVDQFPGGGTVPRRRAGIMPFAS